MLNKSFSIVIPCFNSEKYIIHALNSIIDCNYPLENIEVLIVDDGSTSKDNLYEIVENFLMKYPETFKFYRKENGNWGSVINYVREKKLINNDLVCILDSDDKFKPCFFHVVNNEINDADIFLGSFELVNKNFKKILKVKPYLFNRKVVTSSKKYTSFTFPGSTVYRKEIFYSNIKLAEGHSFQDFPFFFSALKISNKIIWTKKIISSYWKSRKGNSMSSAWNNKKINDWIVSFDTLEKNNIEKYFFWVFLQKGKTIIWMSSILIEMIFLFILIFCFEKNNENYLNKFS